MSIYREDDHDRLNQDQRIVIREDGRDSPSNNDWGNRTQRQGTGYGPAHTEIMETMGTMLLCEWGNILMEMNRKQVIIALLHQSLWQQEQNSIQRCTRRRRMPDELWMENTLQLWSLGGQIRELVWTLSTLERDRTWIAYWGLLRVDERNNRTISMQRIDQMIWEDMRVAPSTRERDVWSSHRLVVWGRILEAERERERRQILAERRREFIQEAHRLRRAMLIARAVERDRARSPQTVPLTQVIEEMENVRTASQLHRRMMRGEDHQENERHNNNTAQSNNSRDRIRMADLRQLTESVRQLEANPSSFIAQGGSGATDHRVIEVEMDIINYIRGDTNTLGRSGSPTQEARRDPLIHGQGQESDGSTTETESLTESENESSGEEEP